LTKNIKIHICDISKQKWLHSSLYVCKNINKEYHCIILKLINLKICLASSENSKLSNKYKIIKVSLKVVHQLLHENSM